MSMRGVLTSSGVVIVCTVAHTRLGCFDEYSLVEAEIGCKVLRIEFSITWVGEIGADWYVARSVVECAVIDM